MDKKPNIHEGHRQRLRDSVDKDPELNSFADHQVLEYLLSFLIPRKDTNPIAHQLINTFGNLYGVLSASSEELYEIPNMTKSAAHLLPNLTAIVRRAEISRTSGKAKIETTDAAVEFLRPYFMNRNHEMFYALSLDINDRVIAVDMISEGLSNFSTVDAAKLVSVVTRRKPCKMIVAHNHPAGTIMPSQEDLACTSMLSMQLSPIGTTIIDHIIFAHNNYFSFYQHNLMNPMFESSDRYLGTDNADRVMSRRELKKYVLEGNLNDLTKTETDERK